MSAPGSPKRDSLERQREACLMSANTFGLIELILVFGLLLGFGFWQLYATRRDQRRADEEAKRRAAGPDGPPQP